MKSHAEFSVETERKIERRDVTEKVGEALASLAVDDGVAVVSTPHTTTAVTVGENWDPDVTVDVEKALASWVPKVEFRHGEGNSPAHLLSEVVGNSRLLPVSKGKLVLGRWQGIFLLELDGPRRRHVRVDVLRTG